jgi:hypothetical protein
VSRGREGGREGRSARSTSLRHEEGGREGGRDGEREGEKERKFIRNDTPRVHGSETRYTIFIYTLFINLYTI